MKTLNWTVANALEKAINYLAETNGYNDGRRHENDLMNTLEEALAEVSCRHEGEQKNGVCLECGTEV